MANPTIPCTRLYVGDLHPDVTEAILYDKFQTYGNILSIRVCRDLVTKKSLGYAYVNYQTSNEAKSAMENINFEDIHGRSCRIMWSQRDPAARRSGVGNIFIKNLDTTITVKEINDTFANFGEISSCKVQTDENGLSKGFAFVNFNREEDAEKAIQAINGKMIREKIVYVAKFIPRNQRNAHNKDFTNCYIKNFATHLNDDSLKSMFEAYGEIVSAKVMVDKEGVSKGFGFVSFKEHEDAVKAVNNLNGKVVEDKTIYVGRAMKKSERQRELRARYEKTRQERLQQHKSGVNLYIKNLGNDINDDRLRQEFTVFGNITSAKVMLNKENNTSKGFGFVCFSAPDEATRAVSEMNGKIVDGKPLYVALAQKKEDRVAHLRSQFQQRVHQPAPTVFNPGMMNFAMNIANPQRPFMARPNNIIQNRWPPNVPYAAMQPRNNMVGMPASQNIMMTAGLPQNAAAAARRNMVDPMMKQNRTARPITGNVQMNQPRLHYNMVANADTMEAKQILGEKLYPLVSKIAGDMAGKITGMFLELDSAELLYMIENENSLRMKIDEALVVLNVHKARDRSGEESNNHKFNPAVIAVNMDPSEDRQKFGETPFSTSDKPAEDRVEEIPGNKTEDRKGLRMPSQESLTISNSRKEGTSILSQSHELIRPGQELKDPIKYSSEDKCEFKQQLRDRIYGIACKYAGNEGERITEILLILSCDELIKIIDDENTFKEKIDKLLDILKSPSVKNEECLEGSYKSGSESSEEVDSTSSYESNSYRSCDNATVTADLPDTFTECSSECAILKETVTDNIKCVDQLQIKLIQRKNCPEELKQRKLFLPTSSLDQPPSSGIDNSIKRESFDKIVKEIDFM